VPASLQESLRALGHDVDTVLAEELTGAADVDVWEAAQAASRFLITQDLDFSDVRAFQPGSHAGILLLRLPVPSRRLLYQYVEQLFRTADVERTERRSSRTSYSTLAVGTVGCSARFDGVWVGQRGEDMVLP
jgi:predicted nuclease of predicted toxin-antitoxin system